MSPLRVSSDDHPNLPEGGKKQKLSHRNAYYLATKLYELRTAKPPRSALGAASARCHSRRTLGDPYARCTCSRRRRHCSTRPPAPQPPLSPIAPCYTRLCYLRPHGLGFVCRAPEPRHVQPCPFSAASAFMYRLCVPRPSAPQPPLSPIAPSLLPPPSCIGFVYHVLRPRSRRCRPSPRLCYLRPHGLGFVCRVPEPCHVQPCLPLPSAPLPTASLIRLVYASPAP